MAAMMVATMVLLKAVRMEMSWAEKKVVLLVVSMVVGWVSKRAEKMELPMAVCSDVTMGGTLVVLMDMCWALKTAV